MRTAIFVYQPTVVSIRTNESNLELSRMDSGTVVLLAGQNEQPIGPGIYKIVSSQDVEVTGDALAFDVVVAPNNKDNPPTLPPRLASQNPIPIDAAALQAFFAVPESKDLANP